MLDLLPFLSLNLATSHAKTPITEGGKSSIYVLTLAQDGSHFSNICADTSIDKRLLLKQKQRLAICFYLPLRIKVVYMGL